jgi:hypothetical protein
MDWEAAGAIGEIVGALAVVISVLYLAFQIRQNTQTVQGATIQGITETAQRENRWSSDLAGVFVKAIESPDSMSSLEAFQMGEWLTAAMMARQNEYLQYQRGLLDQEMWDASIGVVRSIMSIDFARIWWQSWDTSVYNPAFVSVVDEILSDKRDWRFDAHLKSLSGAEETTRDA